MNLVNNDRMTRILSVVLSVIFGVLIITITANAVSTISTNIVTEGDFQVDGNSTIGSAVGDSVTANAYFTHLRIGTGTTFTNIAAVGADELGVEGALEVAGQTYVQEFTQGGGQCTVTDANGGTITLTQAELAACNYLYMTASGQGQEVIALTLPATSTMTTLLASVGDYREWLIDASDLAAATTTTITAGTGIDMLAVTTNEDVIDGGEYSELRCWRKSDTDVACITSELVNAD